jgi:hypothetical protein
MLQKRAISIHALRLMLYDPVAGHGAWPPDKILKVRDAQNGINPRSGNDGNC